MKKNRFRTAICLILTAMVAICAVPVAAAGAGTPIYINSDSNTVNGSLSSLYAVGGGGEVAALPEIRYTP